MTSKIVRKIIATKKAPIPIGPYSQAVLVHHTLYVSGMIGMDPKTQKLVDGDTAAQAKQALINMKNILEEAGSSFDKGLINYYYYYYYYLLILFKLFCIN
ncbi:PREDICTED: ribonuclease UK114 [Wasmannia auropunctata]|uniref:ribonuclease UK114 n=1 Tax=Wasmannia auropunctata TaxID=64793 RepID=UPI0005EE5B0B|nr:PREDICTED: ribonuclease UK114 [Wasmannia auropunctata]